MAIYRKTPVCFVCKKPNMVAVYDKSSKVVGDNFMFWKPIPCDCKKAEKIDYI